MATIRELITRWTFDIDDKPLKEVEGKFSELTGSVKTLAVGIAGVSATIFGFVKLSANAGEEVGKLSDKFGISAQAFQELQFAARGEAEALTASLGIFSKNIIAAKEGTEAQAGAFKKLGISIKGPNGQLKTTEQLITESADGFAKMENGAEKTTLAMTLFGKSGADLIPFLNQGSDEIARLRQEAIDSGAVLGDDAIAGAAAFNDSLDDLMNTIKGIGVSFAADLFGPVGDIIKQFKVWIIQNRKLIGQRLSEVIKGLASFLSVAVKFSIHLIDAIVGLTEVFGGLGNVLKWVGIGFAIFTGGQILAGIGGLILMINKLGMAALLANAKALILPLLIGAAIVALGLIIEDIVAFFQGRDSVTGIIVEKFKAMFAYLEEAFNNFGSVAKIAITVLLTPLRAVINTFQNLLNLIDVFRGKMTFKDFAVKGLKNLANTFGFEGATGSLKGAMGLNDTASAQAGANPLAASVSEVAGVAPTPGSGVLAPTNNSNQNNTFNVDVSVEAGGREDAAVVGRQVGNKTAGELDALMRDTFRTFQGAGGY